RRRRDSDPGGQSRTGEELLGRGPALGRLPLPRPRAGRECLGRPGTAAGRRHATAGGVAGAAPGPGRRRPGRAGRRPDHRPRGGTAVTGPDRGLPLRDARVVITGAAGGIGSALARALADRGARLLLTDLDAGRVGDVAGPLDAAHVAGDITDPDDVRSLVETARTVLGGVDLFCGNAGVAVPGSLEPAAFEISWQVNVLAHVHAARELLPGWLEAGRGRYLATVSAAGLLSMLGNAPYSVTKHAALA